MIRSVFALWVLISASLTAQIAHGQEPLPLPQTATVLKVSGANIVKNTSDSALFDLDMLRALPSTTYDTKTIWTEGKQVFEGVMLDVLMKRLGAKGAVLKLTALNNYAIEMPLTNGVRDGALIAYHRNGAPMKVRDKGPLWLVFPYDSDPLYRSEIYFVRSVWQLTQIEIRH